MPFFIGVHPLLYLMSQLSDQFHPVSHYCPRQKVHRLQLVPVNTELHQKFLEEFSAAELQG